MGLPRLSFNSKNIDLTRHPLELDVFPMRSKLASFSASGLPETKNISAGYSVHILIQAFSKLSATDQAIKTAIFELMEWAEHNQAWVFNADRDITVNTTLDAAVAAGVSSIPVVSASGVVSGSRYAIESPVHVATVDAANTGTDPITIAQTLNYGFASGSRFRGFHYLPLIGSVRIIEQRYALHWDLEINGTVDRRDL